MNLVKAFGKDLHELMGKLHDVEKNSYRYWRVRIIISSIIAYAAFYLVRQNFSMAIPVMAEAFNYSKSELGAIASCFSAVYGIGKFVNGFISDRSNARYFLTIGLMGAAIMNVCMGFCSSLMAFTVFWIANAWFQSMGWPPAARMLTQWFSPSELGTKWALWASSHQIGAALILVIGGYLLTYAGWASIFFVPGIMAAFLAVFSFDRLRDSPKDLGFPPVEEYKDNIKETAFLEEERLSLREVMTLVLRNKWVWYVGIANMCLYIPRMGIFTWAPTFLKEYKGVTLITAGWQLAGFEIAGLVGGVFAGWMSDNIFQGRRGPVGAIFLTIVSVFMALLWVTPAGFPYIDALVLMGSGFFIYGPQVLAGLAAADFASKRAVGVATGVTGSMAYVGGALAGYSIGKSVDVWGWDAAFILFIAASLIGAFFFALTWKQRAKILEAKTEDPV